MCVCVVFCFLFVFLFFGGRGGGVKCDVHLCCNNCCKQMQLTNIELFYNGLITCNLILVIPFSNLEYKTN